MPNKSSDGILLSDDLLDLKTAGRRNILPTCKQAI